MMAVVAIVLAILGGLVLVGVVSFLYIRHRRKVVAEFEALAARHGWRFSEGDDRDRPAFYKGFRPFGQGHSRKASDVVEGSAGEAEFEAFRYVFTTGAGKSQQTHFYRILALQMPLEGHDLRIEREHFGHKVLDALGGEDIDLESDEFSRKFWVQCKDRRFAYDMLHPKAMDHLLAHHGKGTLQWRGRTLMLAEGGTWRASFLDPMLAATTGFRALLPRHRVSESSTKGKTVAPSASTGDKRADPANARAKPRKRL